MNVDNKKDQVAVQESSAFLGLLRALTLNQDNDLEFTFVQCAEAFKPLGTRGVFGGLLLGQTIAAALGTVPTDFGVCSLQSTFMNPGNSSTNTKFKVRKLRDGTGFVTRTVEASQGDLMLVSSVLSFQRIDNKPFKKLEFQTKMPSVPAPETLVSRETLFKKWAGTPGVEQRAQLFLRFATTQPFPIDIRHCNHKVDVPLKFFNVNSASQAAWLRIRGQLSDDPKIHATIAGYLTDYLILTTSLVPLGHPATIPDLSMFATLQQNIWFHSKFRADQWLLYDMESTWAGDGRSLCTGRVFGQDGTLFMTVVQEGLIRFTPPKPQQPPSKL